MKLVTLTTLHDDIAGADYDLATTTYQELHDKILADSGLSESKLRQFDSETITHISEDEFDNDPENKAELLRQAQEYNDRQLLDFKRSLFSAVQKTLYNIQLTNKRIMKSGTVEVDDKGNVTMTKPYSESNDNHFDRQRYHRYYNNKPELDQIKALSENNVEFAYLKRVYGISDKLAKAPKQTSAEYEQAVNDFVERLGDLKSTKAFINQHFHTHDYTRKYKDYDFDKGEEVIKTEPVHDQTYLSKFFNDFEYLMPDKMKYDRSLMVELNVLPFEPSDNFDDYEIYDNGRPKYPLDIFNKRKTKADFEKTDFSKRIKANRWEERKGRAVIGTENYPFVIELNQDKTILLDGFNRLFGNDFVYPDKKVIVKVYHDLDEMTYSKVLYCVNDWKTGGTSFGAHFYDRGVQGSLFVKYGLLISPHTSFINIDTSTNLIEHVTSTKMLDVFGNEYPYGVYLHWFVDIARKKSGLSMTEVSQLMLDHKAEVIDSCKIQASFTQEPARKRSVNEFMDSLLA